MKRNFKITESQYNAALQEGVTLAADVNAANGDINKAVRDTKQQAIKSGVNVKDATISLNANDVDENKILTIKDMKLSYLHEDKKRNSTLFTISNFIKKYNLK